MPATSIREQYEACKGLLRKGLLEEALDGMQQMVTQVKNRDLDDSFTVLSARFYTLHRKQLLLGDDRTEHENSLFLTANHLLDEILEEALRADPSAAAAARPDTENRALRAEIQALQDQIGALLNDRLERRYIPPNYTPDLSKEYQFAFCYPQDWAFDKNKEVNYCRLVDIASMERLGFARNLNIVINELDPAENLPQDAVLGLSAAGVVEQLAAFHREIEVVFEEARLLQGLPAKRWRIDYTMSNGARLALYQVQVADRDMKKLLTISCTTVQEDFEEARVVFDNIMETLVL